MLGDIKNLDFVNCDGFDLGDSISIVGSSAILRERSDADEIDSSSDVMRFNHFRIDGFEGICGSKTTTVLVNNHALQMVVDDDFWENDFKLEYPTAKRNYILDFKNLNIILRLDHSKMEMNKPAIEKVCEKNKVAIVRGEQALVAHNHLGKQPSCGFSGLMVALEFFEDITCYGFNFNNDPNIDKHYYERGNFSGGAHSFSREQEIFKQLADAGRIKLRY